MVAMKRGNTDDSEDEKISGSNEEMSENFAKIMERGLESQAKAQEAREELPECMHRKKKVLLGDFYPVYTLYSAAYFKNASKSHSTTAANSTSKILIVSMAGKVAN
jgi:hypothetical protein